MNFVERLVQRDGYRIYAREYPGEEPPIILMHGFPDNLHLYDCPVAVSTIRWDAEHTSSFLQVEWGFTDYHTRGLWNGS